MTARTLPNVGLKAFWGLGFDGWDPENDLNLLKLSVLVQGTFLSKEATTPGSPTDGDVYVFDETHATQANKIAIRDNGDWVYITPIEGWKLYNLGQGYYEKFDGATWAQENAGLDYRFGCFAEEDIASSEVLMRHVVPYDLVIPPDLSGSVADVATNPAATWDGLLNQNGTTIGTVSISTSGVVTLTTTSGTAKSIAAEDVLTFVAPASADASIAGLTVTFIGAIV